MSYQVTKLPSGRWGIYTGKRLIATIGDQQALNMILAQLSNASVSDADSAERVSA